MARTRGSRRARRSRRGGRARRRARGSSPPAGPARRSRRRRSRSAAESSTAAGRTRTGGGTRRHRGTAGGGRRRSSCPSGSSCPRPLRAGSSQEETLGRRRIGPSTPPRTLGLAGLPAARGATISLQNHNGVEPENWRLPRTEVGGTVPRAVEAPRALRRAAAPVAALAVLGPAGCGGGARQDAAEPAQTYHVAIVRASFPGRQRLAAPARLVVEVRNTGKATVPNVAVTVESFSARSDRADLADAERPVWVIDRPPGGSTTAYTNTWALGPMFAGETKEFVWRVTPVQAGTHRLRYRIAAGLNGRAKAVLSGNRVPEREQTVRVSSQPAPARVNPETGAVEHGG